jgi:hypothetical protein
MARRGTLRWGMAAAAIFGLAACDAVLGMDAPSLAPCADGCPDGALADGADGAVMPGPDGAPEAEAAAADATPESSRLDAGADVDAEASTDAAPDVNPDQGTPVGIRCGGGAFPTSWCDPAGSTPLCCQGGTPTAPTFTCVAAGACTGYSIECANYNDCSGTDICCRFVAHQICDLPANCPNDELVCDSLTTDVCPTGKACDVPFVGDAAAQSPYLGCEP